MLVYFGAASGSAERAYTVVPFPYSEVIFDSVVHLFVSAVFSNESGVVEKLLALTSPELAGSEDSLISWNV